MHPGLFGAIAGGVIGLAGGIFGTWCSIRGARGPREKRFIIRASIVGWLTMALFLAVLLVPSSPYRHLAWLPYSVLFPLALNHANRRLRQIRRLELGSAGEGDNH